MTPESQTQPPRRRRGTAVLLAAALVGAGLGGGAVLLAGRMGAPHDDHAGHDHAEGAHAAAEVPLYQCSVHPSIQQHEPGTCPIDDRELVKVDPPRPAAGVRPVHANAKSAPAKAQYICPMHPSIVSDEASDCPICGMKLVKAEAPPAATGGSGGSASAAAGPTQYICPMHPQIVSEKPSDCPICGMKLVKSEGGGDAGGAATPAGLATVTIDPSRQQLIGLRTARAADGQVGGSWRAAGRVAIDETRVHHVNVKVGGFIEHDHASFVGKTVKKGEPLFAIYSPELLAAQDEYLLALRTRDQLASSGTSAQGDALVESARRKLQLWDVPASEIARLEKTEKSRKNLVFYSPAAGVVTKRDVVPGMRIEAGAMPYEIVDLTRVWVLADVYESELRHVKVGLPATLTLKAYPNKKFEGRVVFIDPMLDPKTRTVKVRLEFPNPALELKPEMFGEVLLEAPKRDGVVVPPDAVIDSGTMQVVFVSLGEGRFEPRQVKLGTRDGQHVEVVEGLHAGEEVVTGANYLVDSESRLRASLAALASGAAKAAPASGADEPAAGGAGAAADPHAGHGGR